MASKGPLSRITTTLHKSAEPPRQMASNIQPSAFEGGNINNRQCSSENL
jgi:hypothetical protein